MIRSCQWGSVLPREELKAKQALEGVLVTCLNGELSPPGRVAISMDLPQDLHGTISVHPDLEEFGPSAASGQDG